MRNRKYFVAIIFPLKKNLIRETGNSIEGKVRAGKERHLKTTLVTLFFKYHHQKWEEWIHIPEYQPPFS